MPDFRKGQLVAVRDIDDCDWQLRVYDYERAGQHFCQDPEREWSPSVWWAQIRPAEEIWPNIFLQCDRGHGNYLEELCLEKCKSARLACVVEKLRRRIRWMCQLNGKLNDELNAEPTSYCPPEKRKSDEPCVESCAKCWEQAILKDVEG